MKKKVLQVFNFMIEGKKLSKPRIDFFMRSETGWLLVAERIGNPKEYRRRGKSFYKVTVEEK